MKTLTEVLIFDHFRMLNTDQCHRLSTLRGYLPAWQRQNEHRPKWMLHVDWPLHNNKRNSNDYRIETYTYNFF